VCNFGTHTFVSGVVGGHLRVKNGN